MKIMVSACLLGENCKYNGGNNRNEKLLQLLSGHTVIPVCPEVLGGLPTPRIPAEIVNGYVTNREGTSVDEAFRAGAERALEIAQKEQPDLIVLQSRSPSCGVKQIYDGTFSGTLVPGRGVFAELAQKAGFRVKDVETLLNVFQTLIDHGATVVVIEHDLDVIRSADYIIDMGPEGGEDGGRIVACGTPEEIKSSGESITGKYI